ncbi:hypothetical protein ACFL6N_00375 [Thermodesulfobacteriota bacterium]
MIRNVWVFLDDNELEFMDGAFRCGYIVSEDEQGETIFHQNLLDNSGYLSVNDIVDEVTGLLQIRRENVTVCA